MSLKQKVKNRKTRTVNGENPPQEIHVTTMPKKNRPESDRWACPRVIHVTVIEQKAPPPQVIHVTTIEPDLTPPQKSKT